MRQLHHFEPQTPDLLARELQGSEDTFCNLSEGLGTRLIIISVEI